MRTWSGIALGVVIGLTVVYLPLIIQQAMVPNLMISGTRDEEDLTSAKVEGAEEDAVPGERLPILIAIVGLGAGIAYATYLYARGRRV